MAGDNQHFIPQFLQRGFSSHREGKTAYTWVFRPGSSPINERIKDVGTGWQFYTEPNDTVVDDTITTAENRFANLANRLKSCPSGPVAESGIPEFLVHLEVRTRHLREVFLAGGRYTISRLLEMMADTDAFIALILKRIAGDPLYIRSLVMDEANKAQLNPRDHNALVAMAMKSAESMIPSFLEKLKPAIAQHVSELRTELPTHLARAAKEGHLKALKKSIAPEVRSDWISGLSYSVHDISSANWILGDSAVLFQVDGSRPFRGISDAGNDVRAVFLPLTSQRILVGERIATAWDHMALKRQFARCSFEYFVGHENTRENVTLAEEIGVDAAPMTLEQLDDLALEVFRGFGDPANGHA